MLEVLINVMKESTASNFRTETF